MESQFEQLEKQVECVVRLYKEGKSVNQIYKCTDVSKPVISFLLRQAGFTVKSYKGENSNSPSKEEVNKFISLYKAGKNASEIGRELGYSYKTVLNYLEKEGLRETKPNVTSKEIAEINTLYQSGLSSYAIADKLGISKTTALYHIEETRPYGPIPTKVNSDFFEEIDNQDKAYWLGIMYADGNVSSGDNSITLSVTDEGMVKAFKQVLASEHNIYTRERSKENPKWKDAYTLTIFNAKLRGDLIKHGCIPNKTDSVQLPALEPELYRHFIRGIFDGDGSVWTTGNRGYFSITGYLPFLDKLQDIIVAEAGVSKTKLAERKPDFGDIRYGGKAPMKQLYDYLYRDARYFLRRKRDKFKEIIEQ